MEIAKASTVFALVIGAAVAGCKSDPSEEPTAAKSETMTETVASTPPPAPTAKPTATASTPAVAAPALADKDMTHVLAKDESYYTGMPAAGKAPAGKLKAGTKVIVVMPRGSYSQVMTADGKSVYTSTAALKPVGS